MMRTVVRFHPKPGSTVGRLVAAVDREYSDCGLVSFCSWERLTEVMRAAGQVGPREKITGFEADESGITLHIGAAPAEERSYD